MSVSSRGASGPERPEQTGPDPLIGQVLEGRYRVDAAVGRGGMGSVYRGVHLLMERTVALKVLRPDLAVDPTAARRFLREAKSTFRFDQEHCVRVTDFGATADGVLYIVMEYLQGKTVWDVLHAAPIAGRRIAHIARQVCVALDHAHSLGFVHRDLKPDNIMLVRRGGDPDFVKVLDFGLAKIFDVDAAAGGTLFSMLGLTQEGSVFGTPEYMSPEQAQGAPLDPRTDIYSLGVVMYEMATGMLPFDADKTVEILAKQVQETPVPPRARRPDLAIAEELDRFILACLEKRPADRPQDARSLADRLADLEASLPETTAPAPRVPRRVASQPTEELSGAAAAVPDAPAPAPAPAAADRGAAMAPAPGIGAPARKTLRGWHARDEASAEAPPGEAPPAEAPPADPPPPAIAASPAIDRVAASPDPGRRRWAVAALAAIAVVAVALWVLTRAAAAPPVPGAAGADRAGAVARPAVHALSGGRPGRADAGASAGAAAGTARDAAPADAAPAGAAPATPRRAAPRAGRHDAAVRRHVRAAEAARRDGNTLKQLAEADTALRLDSHSRRAAFLVGDALVKSGEVKAGCRYLSRARALRSARAAARRAGCAPRGD